MAIYTAVVLIIVILSSIILTLALGKKNLLNIHTVLAIALSSVAISVTFPFMMGSFMGSPANVGSFNPLRMGIGWTLLTVLVIYTAVILMLTIIISLFVSHKNLEEISKAVKSGALASVYSNISQQAYKIMESFKNGSMEEMHRDGEAITAGIQKMEECDIVEAAGNKTPEETQNILEKPVDSEQNIDKMGVDTLYDEYSDADKEIGINSESVKESELFEEREVLEAHDEATNHAELQDYAFDANITQTTVLPILPSTEDIFNANYVNENEVTISGLADEVSIHNEDTEVQDSFAEIIPADEFVQDILNVDYNNVEVEEQTIHLDNEVLEEMQGAVPEATTGGAEICEPVEDVEVQNIYIPDSEVTQLAMEKSDDSMDMLTRSSENLNIDDCIDEAFRLKEKGDLEGAILYYMYALDKKPDKDLVFWIILDTCVLYKELDKQNSQRKYLKATLPDMGI